MTPDDTAPRARGDRLELLLYAAVVLLGAALTVVTALNQPYNQNEAQQIAPYGSPDLGDAVSGTRQPPLGPLLGVLVQRTVGEGQLAQRLVPCAAGVGSLVVVALLLRRLRLGLHGPLALLLLATAPLFLRYSAYARPYALPMFLMLVCAYAGCCWLADGRRRWLLLAFVTALLLPAARVPEPAVFLTTAALALGIAGLRRSLPRARAWPLGGSLLLALVTTGTLFLVQLAAQSTGTEGRGELLDLSPGHALRRLPAGMRQVVDYVAPLYATWFPWWPLVLATIVLGLVLSRSRHRLLSLWYWLPLVLAPLVFLLAFQTIGASASDIRAYRIRFGYFAVPPLVLLTALTTYAVSRDGLGRWSRRIAPVLGPLLAAALVLAQLPTTWRVLTQDDAIDLAQAGAALHAAVPDDAIVLYDGPGETGRWRQPFFERDRYLQGGPRVVDTVPLAKGRRRIGGDAPIYLLLLDGECVSTVVCDGPAPDWGGAVPGYERVARVDRFGVYAPTNGQAGAAGAVEALTALVSAWGPRYAVPDAVAAARLLVRQGRRSDATELLDRVCADHPPGERRLCRQTVADFGAGRLLP